MKTEDINARMDRAKRKEDRAERKENRLLASVIDLCKEPPHTLMLSNAQYLQIEIHSFISAIILESTY